MKKKPPRKYHRDAKFLAIVGSQIRQLRKAKNMSQQQLALKCKGIDYTQIGKMERGEVNFTISYLPLIAKALKVHPSDLLPPKP